MALPTRIPPQHVPVLTDAIHTPVGVKSSSEEVDAIVRAIIERLRPQIEQQVREALLRGDVAAQPERSAP